jgi:transcriptional regulator with XRE-family HTH domain
LTAFRRSSPEEQINELIRRVDAGAYMTNLRTERGISLANLGKVLEISANFISEIERGVKSPGDKYIRNFSNYFNINENFLFRKYDKIPLLAREELADNVVLQQMLIEISSNQTLTGEQKSAFYDDMFKHYQLLLAELDAK